MRGRDGRRALVSVVVPAYNAAAHLRPTLASALAQTYAALEVLVVNDGSTDETVALVEAFAAEDERVRLLHQPNRGVAAARNLGILHAEGDYIAPLDADDLWHPRKIEAQVRTMEGGGEGVGLVYAWWSSIDGAGARRYAAHPWAVEGDVYEALLSFNFIGNASVPLLRRDSVEAVGGYDPTLRARGGQGCEDWDLALRIAERYEFLVTPAYLVEYRLSWGSMSADCKAMKRSYDLMMQHARSRHPGTPERVYRCAESHFCRHLADVSWSEGRRAEAWGWFRRAFLGGAAVATPWRAALALDALPAPLRKAAAPLARRWTAPSGYGLRGRPELGASPSAAPTPERHRPLSDGFAVD
ncbi:MAG: glycosyltransferase family 2 protein [Rhodothermales bacterium]|nr:glycosyltransferase family 2 protein [Rhodothermales bacterium]